MSTGSRRVTRNMKKKEIDDGRQVPFCDASDDEFDDITKDDTLCKHSLANSCVSYVKASSSKSGLKTVTRKLQKVAIDEAKRVDDKASKKALKAEWLAIEARAMREKAKLMEQHSLRMMNSESDADSTSDNEESEIEPAEETEPLDEERIRKYLFDCENKRDSRKGFPKEERHANDAQDRLGHFNKSEMPRMELPKFDGNTADYWTFVKQFEMHVEARTDDSSQRMLFLMNHCIGKAKEAIKGFAILTPDVGYPKARALLKRLFGRPNIVSRNMINDILGCPKIPKHDADSLNDLFIKMSTCYNTLKQMHYMADINAMTTLQRIVKKLPDEVKDRWNRKSCKIYGMEREPMFKDLLKFIDLEASIAQNQYDDQETDRERVQVHGARQEVRTENRWKPGPSRMIHHIDQSPKIAITPVKCIICNDDHRLSQCPEYCKLTVGERWTMTKQWGCCYSCLGTGHLVKECRNRTPCRVKGCIKRHHPSLHSAPIGEGGNKVVLNSVREEEQVISLGIMPIMLVGPKGRMLIHALLDSGANTTLVRRDIAKKVGIAGSPTSITINTVTGESDIAAERCNFLLQALDESDRVEIRGAFAVDSLPVRMSFGSDHNRDERWPHLTGIPNRQQEDGHVVMIIGLDQPKAHWVQEVKKGLESQPFGMKTPLGWIVLGPMYRDVKKEVHHVNCKEDDKRNELETLIGKLYNSEFQDVGSNEKEHSRDEIEALNIVKGETVIDHGRYVVPLPWKEYPPQLTDNKHYAVKRLISLNRRFKANPGLIERYDAIIQDQLRKEYVREVPEAGMVNDHGSWYLPHHPVFNPKKPDKLRIVFDCAATYRNKSINDCLHQGPDTIANLAGILLRFRRLPIVIMADVEEMFLRVKLFERDQEWMRFVWWENGKLDGRIRVFKMVVHPFGATSSPFCANYALQRTITDNCVHGDKETIAVARRNIYVDDCIASVRDENIARKVIKELTFILSQGGFRLRKWLSNKKDVLTEVPNEDLAKNVQLLVAKELPTERALGVEWDAELDGLRFTFTDPGKPNTRRGLLSTIATVFDPLGLISPVILPAKVLLQSMCRRKLDWDQLLEGDELTAWCKWKQQMSELKGSIFPRCIRHDEVGEGELQLHLFADASETGYGAVAYVRMRDKHGGYQSRLLMSKSRVTPLKTVTIPRLELNAAVLAVRLCKTINREFDESFASTSYWVDSMIVLRYLHNTTSRFATFVANRVQEILEASHISQWRHVKSEFNPADYASRGLSVHDPNLMTWMKGPKFLEAAIEEWPSSILLPACEDGLETKKLVLHVERKPERAMDKLLEHYSNWYRMSRAVAWLARFKEYLRTMNGKGCSLKVGNLSPPEIDKAESDIFRYVQRISFPEEYNEIFKVNGHEPGFSWRTSRLRKLCPKQRNGLLVVDGRCNLASISEDSKYPIILPKDHAVTTALILWYHEREGHAGVNQTLAATRERLWILHGGATIKRMTRKCIICRRLNATSAGQRMASLPVERVRDGWFPFQQVGLDYFGPFQIKRGRLLEKRYGCIFTCMQCRAIHLELAQTLSTDSFILALMRFVNRRGIPEEFRSDNGSNFIGAEKELREWLVKLEQTKIVDALTERKISWSFNPPVASHRGGIWERMIRSVRKILNSVAGRGSMDEELLWTYLTQAERIINDRPLTMVREGQGEPIPIRPSDLLQPKGRDLIAVNLPLSQLVEKRWRIVNGLTVEFWKRWKSEYLSTLQARQKWTVIQRELQPGDLVITEVESTPRTYWPMGLIEEVIPDGDGQVRTVLVKTSSGRIRRDIRKVYRLEGVG